MFVQSAIWDFAQSSINAANKQSRQTRSKGRQKFPRKADGSKRIPRLIAYLFDFRFRVRIERCASTRASRMTWSERNAWRKNICTRERKFIWFHHSSHVSNVHARRGLTNQFNELIDRLLKAMNFLLVQNARFRSLRLPKALLLPANVLTLDLQFLLSDLGSWPRNCKWKLTQRFLHFDYWKVSLSRVSRVIRKLFGYLWIFGFAESANLERILDPRGGGGLDELRGKTE